MVEIAGGFLSHFKHTGNKAIQKCLMMNIKYLQLPGKRQFCNLILGEDGEGRRAIKEEILELNVVIVAKMLKRREF